MTRTEQIDDMARTLVDHGVNLTDDRAAIMCLVGARYRAPAIGSNLDHAIYQARRISEATEVLALDEKLRAVSAAMGRGHVA